MKHVSDPWAASVRRNGKENHTADSGVSDVLPVFAENFLLAFLSLSLL